MSQKGKKSFLSGFFSRAGSALLCALCCLVPVALIVIGINTIGLYLFLAKYQMALWGLLVLTAVTYFIFRSRAGRGAPMARRLLLINLIFTGSLLYLSYTSAPIIIPPGYPRT